MSCYVASNDNRIYAALESGYGIVAAAAANNALPAIRLALEQTTDRPERRDKTGHRTYQGHPAGFRKRVSYEVSTYMSGWDQANPEPVYGPLFQAALGGQPITFPGATVAAAVDPTQVQTTTPHGLAAGQAVRAGGELRFVAAIVDATTFIMNAPLVTPLQAGQALEKTVTYQLANDLASVSLFDYWDPSASIQRIVAGGAVDKMRLRINGDFHQFEFSGDASELIDSATFSAGAGGLTAFPPEPAGTSTGFSLVPGSLGQAWFGAQPQQFHTVLSAEISLVNNLDLRTREFGETRPRCISAGRRRVSVDMQLVSESSPEAVGLYQASAQESPIAVMLQLGQVQAHLCAAFLPLVIPEVPEFDGEETRLRWRFRNCRAQGTVNDEIVIAFG